MATSRARARVLLCVMPFVPLERPALGTSLLKALVSGFATCKVLYACHRFADDIGFELYRRVAQLTPTHHLAGDWIFTRALDGAGARPDSDFERFALGQAGQFYDHAFLGQLAHARARAPDFIDRLAAQIVDEGWPVVGFSTTFQQNIASLALAKRIKALAPATRIVFGGANCEGPMGIELMRQFEPIDYVCRGEADIAFPALLQHLVGSTPADLHRIPGLVFRDAAGVQVSRAAASTIDTLDASPLPDHGDFVTAFERSTAALFVLPELTAETSRGCWWGEKHHCTFCGLNGLGIRYRAKSPERAIDEIRTLRDTYGIPRIFFTDNIVDMGYFDKVMPALADDGVQMQLFYETKANLRKSHLEALRRVGTTWLQPGIEHLNSHVLTLMDKGIRGIQNVQTLKWSRQYGFLLTWNILCGFPGEAAEDYEALGRVMRDITHLTPPSSFAAFRMDRFSPMHNHPERFGLGSVQPFPSYALCYPVDEAALAGLAYFFTCRGSSPATVIDAINRAWLVCEEWKRAHLTSMLAGVAGEDALLILDTRPVATRPHHVLQAPARWVYEAADSVCSLSTLMNRLARTHPEASWTEAGVQAALDAFEADHLVLREGHLYLALAVLESGPHDAAGDEDAAEASLPSATWAPIGMPGAPAGPGGRRPS